MPANLLYIYSSKIPHIPLLSLGADLLQYYFCWLYVSIDMLCSILCQNIYNPASFSGATCFNLHFPNYLPAYLDWIFHYNTYNYNTFIIILIIFLFSIIFTFPDTIENNI